MCRQQFFFPKIQISQVLLTYKRLCLVSSLSLSTEHAHSLCGFPCGAPWFSAHTVIVNPVRVFTRCPFFSVSRMKETSRKNNVFAQFRKTDRDRQKLIDTIIKQLRNLITQQQAWSQPHHQTAKTGPWNLQPCWFSRLSRLWLVDVNDWTHQMQIKSRPGISGRWERW